MTILRTLCAAALAAAWAAPAHGETARPFGNLFNVPAVSASTATHEAVGDQEITALADPAPLGESAPLGDSAPLAEAAWSLQQADPHPAPRHTGFAALVYSTAADFKAFPRRRSTWVILGIGAGAAALAHPADDNVNGRLVGSRGVGRLFAPGKYIGAYYTQVGVATGLYVIGRYVLPHAEGEPKTNKLSHLGFDLFRALAVSQALTQATKYIVRRDRPTGECCAFPSGHASSTFAFASVLERHLGYRGAWPTFVIASYVAASRLHDNRHFLSDVLFGSALGIASGWTVVGRHGRSDYTMLPVPIHGGMMMSFAWHPDEPQMTRH